MSDVPRYPGCSALRAEGERRQAMVARWLTPTGWVIPAPFAAVTEWVASRWAREPARIRDVGGTVGVKEPRCARTMPSGPHPHASATLSLWQKVELFSR